MSVSSRTIRTAEATAALRTVAFRLVDPATGEGKTGVAATTALLSTNHAVGVATSANFSEVEQGWYKVILTTGECTLSVGTHIKVGIAENAAYTCLWGEAVIVAATQYDAELTDDDIAAAVLAAAAVTPIAADVKKLLGTAWLTPAVAGTPDVNTKTLTAGAIVSASAAAGFYTAVHNALLDGFIAWLKADGFNRPNVTGNATLKNSAGADQTVAITTSADAEGIVSTT